MIALLCAALSGAMFYLSQGLDDVWWLAWFAPLPLLWLAYGDAPRGQVFAASLTAFAMGDIYMIQIYGLPLLAGVLAMMLGMGGFLGGAMLFARWMRRRMPAAALFAFPALWTAIEYLAGWVSPHGSWGALAYSQVSFPAAIQIAALLGLYGVTFLLCLFANALALLSRGVREPAAAGLMLCALALAFGVAQLATPQTSALRVVALADYDAHRKATRKPALDATLAATRQYADALRGADPRTRLAVIPETSIVLDSSWQDAALAPLVAVARERRMTIVIGAVRTHPLRNSALAIQPNGEVNGYDKRHLLPPFENVYRPGRAPGLIGSGRAMAICKDLDFPRTLRADALTAKEQGGIRLLAVPANDFTGDGWIHTRMAIMRGVENGFAVVRSAFQGLETVSDAQGRVIARADTNRHGLVTIAAMVEPGGGPTPYVLIGDAFAWACIAVSLVLGLVAARKENIRPREV